MKKVSVIIAAYNVEKYIVDCLKSVLNQTYSNLQIIIVNDNTISLISHCMIRLWIFVIVL